MDMLSKRNKEKQKEREMKCKKNLKKELTSESLLVRVNHLTVPPSHAAEALANPKRDSGTTAATQEPTARAPLSIWPNEFACQ